MAGSIITERRIADAPALAIGGKFSKFGPEEEKAVGKAEVKEDDTLKEFKHIYTWLRHYENPRFPIGCDVFLTVSNIVQGMTYSAEDVVKFTIALAEFQDDRFGDYAGRFLSALIANGKDEEYIIPTRHLSIPLEYLGTQNTKRIIVDGPVGEALGYEMRSGSIVVKGDSAYWCGHCMRGGSITVYGNGGHAAGLGMLGGTLDILGDAGEEIGSAMEGGLIIVEGNTGDKAGSVMRGGTVVVCGNAGELAGELMHGGEIIIRGGIRSLGKHFGGRIYINGRLIADQL